MDRRATLIGRFLLLSIIGLILLIPLWYMAAPLFARPPTWLAGKAMEALFPWVKGFDLKAATSILYTSVQVRMRGPSGDVFVEATPSAPYPILGYGVALVWAMLIASRTPKWWLKGLAATAILFVSQAVGICFVWLKNLVVSIGPAAIDYLGVSRFQANAILYGHQFSVLMMTPMLPILLWLLFNKRFVAALWLEAALDGPGEKRTSAQHDTAVKEPQA